MKFRKIVSLLISLVFIITAIPVFNISYINADTSPVSYNINDNSLNFTTTATVGTSSSLRYRVIGFVLSFNIDSVTYQTVIPLSKCNEQDDIANGMFRYSIPFYDYNNPSSYSLVNKFNFEYSGDSGALDKISSFFRKGGTLNITKVYSIVMPNQSSPIGWINDNAKYNGGQWSSMSYSSDYAHGVYVGDNLAYNARDAYGSPITWGGSTISDILSNSKVDFSWSGTIDEHVDVFCNDNKVTTDKATITLGDGMNSVSVNFYDYLYADILNDVYSNTDDIQTAKARIELKYNGSYDLSQEVLDKVQIPIDDSTAVVQKDYPNIDIENGRPVLYSPKISKVFTKADFPANPDGTTREYVFRLTGHGSLQFKGDSGTNYVRNDKTFTLVVKGRSGPDFSIMEGGTNQTDSTVTKTISSSTQYGTTPYSVTLVPNTMAQTNVSSIEWVKDGTSLGSTSTTVYGSSVGKTTTFGMRVHFKDGTYFPSSTTYAYHNIIINEDQQAPSSNGAIVFTPNSSFNQDFPYVPSERNGWSNKTINVNVGVNSSKKPVLVQESQSRGYSYQQSHTGSRTVYDKDGKPSTESYTYYTTEYGTASCGVSQYWTPSTLSVSSTDGQINTSISDGGSVLISKDAKNLKLNASVSSWQPSGSPSWDGGSPPQGSWSGGGPSTTKSPLSVSSSYAYNSQSGYFNIDTVSPTLDSAHPVNPTSRYWTNQTILVPISVIDNPTNISSGFWSPNSYYKLTDKSYLNKGTTQMQNFNDKAVTDTKTVTINSDGIYKIDVNLEDYARNTYISPTFQDYKFDKTPPKPITFSYDNRQYLSDNLNVTVTVGDNLSGLETVRYSLVNTSNPSYTTNTNVTTIENADTTATFNVNITQTGSWWIHVYTQDRAGNVTVATSPMYRIVRIQDNFPHILPDSNYSNGTANIPRSGRFDVASTVLGLTESDAKSDFKFEMNVPNWVFDKFDKKIGGSYGISIGNGHDYSTFWDGHTVGSQNEHGDTSSSVQYWRGYIAPFGVPLTKKETGASIRPKYTIETWLSTNNYHPDGGNNPTRTKSYYVDFDVVQYTKLKTEIVTNDDSN